MQTKSFWVGALVIVIFSLAIWGTYVLYQRRVSQSSPTAVPSPPPDGFGPSPTPSPIPTTDQFSVPTTGIVTPSQPETGVGSNFDSGLVITEPREMALIKSPQKISIWTKIASGNIVVQAKDNNGNILGQNLITTCTNWQVCYFETILDFATPRTKSGTIEAFSEHYLKIIPVNF